MNVADFDFDLPPGQIAQTARPRGESRLLMVDRSAGTWREYPFRELPSLVAGGDVMVANDTRVFPARLIGRRDPSGGRVECLLLEHAPPGPDWLALVHPGQKLKTGTRAVFEDAERAPGVRIEAEILERKFFGRRLVRLTATGAASIDAAVDALGRVPLPPYIDRPDTAADRERYQTVFADSRGSVAAPTAGLHFDEGIIRKLKRRGVIWQTITLHVGYGTFKPVRVDRVEEHTVDPEPYVIAPPAADAIHTARSAGSRVIAVGTTTTRALESSAIAAGRVEPGTGVAEKFIYPGYEFQVVTGLLTNFHLPKSSLLMLVAAFAGQELTLAAYRHAVAEGFRFYSYGDAMLIL